MIHSLILAVVMQFTNSTTTQTPILGPLANPSFGIWPQVILAFVVGWLSFAALRNGAKFGIYIAGLVIIFYALYQNPVPNLTSQLLPIGTDIFQSIIKLIQSQGYLTIIAFAVGFMVSWQQPQVREAAAKKLI